MPRKTRYIPLDLAGSSGNGPDPGQSSSWVQRPHGPQDGNRERDARGTDVDGLVEAFAGSSIRGAHEGVNPRLRHFTPGGYPGGVQGHLLGAASLHPGHPPSSLTPPGFLSATAASFVPSLPIPLLQDPRRRKAIHFRPITGKVYYLPDPNFIGDSMIHRQNRKLGFFKHPVLVVGMENEKEANFYSLTKEPPKAIKELRMCLRIGEHQMDKGGDVLALASGSDTMNMTTWVNLEQRFSIEWYNLDAWLADVRVQLNELDLKLWSRVNELEADQNRYLYKPLPRDMAKLAPGSIVMMLNDESKSSTLGAPVLILENWFPKFLYLRVKEINENIYFNPNAKKRNCIRRDMCLQLSKEEGEGHGGTPLLATTPGSPATREPSYVEVLPAAKVGHLDWCKTWCFPPIVLTKDSLRVLREYMVKTQPQFSSERPLRKEKSIYHPSDVRYPGRNTEAESSSARQFHSFVAPPQHQNPYYGYESVFRPGDIYGYGSPYQMDGGYHPYHNGYHQTDGAFEQYDYGHHIGTAPEEHKEVQDDASAEARKETQKDDA